VTDGGTLHGVVCWSTVAADGVSGTVRGPEDDAASATLFPLLSNSGCPPSGLTDIASTNGFIIAPKGLECKITNARALLKLCSAKFVSKLMTVLCYAKWIRGADHSK